MAERNLQYFNDGQQYMLSMNPRDLVAVCGRGFGKGAVQAFRLLTAVQGMPGSTGGFVAPSQRRCLKNILPSMLVHLERWGYHRDIHYLVGRKPPKALRWRQPVISPEDWGSTICFWNGSVVNIISQDRVGTSNSMSLDYLIIDEAKFIDFERLKNETFQANRGNQMYFGRFFMHHGMTITSDMPVTKKGSWFLRYREQMDPELVAVLEGAVAKRCQLRRSMEARPERRETYQARIDRLEDDISFLRSRCLLYKEYTSIDNLAILGEDYIRRMKRELPPLTFATSVMCQRVGIAADGFYGGMSEARNLYRANNQEMLRLSDVGKRDMPDDCRMDTDLDPSLPLVVAFDANANINWCVVGQVTPGKLKIIKSFFVKYERKLPELVDDVARYYRFHKRKQVIFYFDDTFKGNNYAIEAGGFYRQVTKRFRAKGWTVTEKYIGQPMQHVEKNQLINRMFRGRANHTVFINSDNNPDLLISITSAGIYNGKKDKRGEKLVETEEDRLESRTDGSDAFDTICIGVEMFPVLQLHYGMANSYG